MQTDKLHVDPASGLIYAANSWKKVTVDGKDAVVNHNYSQPISPEEPPCHEVWLVADASASNYEPASDECQELAQGHFTGKL